VTPILSPAGAMVIDEIARNRTLLAFDFDGTLAPIVNARAEARMRDETRALLRTASLLYPCAVISGRTRPDVAARVEGLPLVAVIGNHGAEPGFGPLDPALRAQVASWRETLERTVRLLPGVDLEDKRFGVALHYRLVDEPAETERRLLEAAAALEGARVFRGNAVVNVVPADAPTKGDALVALCRKERAGVAVYIGDDATDEDAFRCEVVHVSIRVGACADSGAAYCLASQDEVDALLRALIAARARHDGLGPRWEGLVRAARA
jgi:trehalose 6-phosphate phosphatase